MKKIKYFMFHMGIVWDRFKDKVRSKIYKTDNLARKEAELIVKYKRRLDEKRDDEKCYDFAIDEISRLEKSIKEGNNPYSIHESYVLSLIKKHLTIISKCAFFPEYTHVLDNIIHFSPTFCINFDDLTWENYGRWISTPIIDKNIDGKHNKRVISTHACKEYPRFGMYTDTIFSHENKQVICDFERFEFHPIKNSLGLCPDYLLLVMDRLFPLDGCFDDKEFFVYYTYNGHTARIENMIEKRTGINFTIEKTFNPETLEFVEDGGECTIA